jgi:hypothetical protein
MTKQFNRRLFLALALLTSSQARGYYLSLSYNDPVPVYSTLSAYHYLLERQIERMFNGSYDDSEQERFCVAITPIYQRATRGNTDTKARCELGDIHGRMNMVAALPFNTYQVYNSNGELVPPATLANNDAGTVRFTSAGNDVPPGKSFPQSVVNTRDNTLGCIAERFIGDGVQADSIPSGLLTVEGLLGVQNSVAAATGQELVGFFSRPMQYRKRGIRFEVYGRLFRDFGFCVRGGVATINQTVNYVDLTNSKSCKYDCEGKLIKTKNIAIKLLNAPNIYFNSPRLSTIQGATNTIGLTTDDEWEGVLQCITNNLMNNVNNVAEAYDINLCNFNETSIEDVHGEVFWRHPFMINENAPDCEWTNFIVTPFVAVGGSAGIAKSIDYNRLNALPFGNNGHNSLTFNTGVLFDFARTKWRPQHIEFGVQAGFAHFFSKKFCNYRMPNNNRQQDFYPFYTDVEVTPGKTWQGSIILNSYHFCNNMSFVSECIFASHNRDSIVVLDPDPTHVYKPEDLECQSSWNAQVLNLGLNWDISPSAFLGFATQQPLSRRGAYRSTSYLLTFGLSY